MIVLSTLVESADLRVEIGNKGRETVVNEYCVKAYQNKYLEVFQNAKPSR
jgi:hypothetical protein